MKRIIKMILMNLLRIPPMWIKLCLQAAHPENYSDEVHLKLFKYIVERANIGGNVVLDTYGLENIPPKDGYIITPNHQGLYDVLAILGTCPRPIFMVYKKELKNIPLIKQVATCTRSLMMDREDIRQSMTVIVDAIKEVKKGRNCLIFPEGTRSKNGNTLGEFKGGTYKIATKTKCPIVPVALIDSFKPFDSDSLDPVHVQVRYLEPIMYEEYKDMKTTEIADMIQTRIQNVINENLPQEDIPQENPTTENVADDNVAQD